MTIDAINPILQWLNQHPNLAGLVTFLISASESIAIIGTIVPGSVTMTAVGTLAGAGVIPFWSTILWAIAGAFIGDNASYWTGHYFKDGLTAIWPFRSYPQLLSSGKKFIYQHGMKSVFIGRFIGPVRALVPIVAGMLGMKPLRYISISVVASLLWAPLYMLPGILIGKATLELPPDVAVHAIMTCVLAALFAIFCIWTLYKIFDLIRLQINQILTAIWMRLLRSRYFHVFTTLLKHHDMNKTHGQLILAFYLMLTCVGFLYLSTYVLVKHSDNITLNTIMYYLCRGFRTPGLDHLMIDITLLGDKMILIPCIFVMGLYLGLKKYWRASLHTFVLLALTISSVLLFKNSMHSPRPWGILNNPETFSFPSGHTTITMVFYFGFCLLILGPIRGLKRKLLYLVTAFFVLSLCFSRLYLGAHWLTDVFGGLLLGAILLMVTALSYNRHAEKPLPIAEIITVAFLSLFLSFSSYYFMNIDKIRTNYQTLPRPTQTVSLEDWWHLSSEKIAMYRVGRLGLDAEAFNLQWVGNIDDIKKSLIQSGWQEAPSNNWVSLLHRIADVSSEEHIPWVDPLYLDKKPIVVLTKQISGNHNIVILRLWDANTLIAHTPYHLWLGSVGNIPRTYSWLIRYKNTNEVNLSPDLLFEHPPTNLDLESVKTQIYFKGKQRRRNETLILIKPKTLALSNHL